ncbi:VOC family protein [Pseudactinotalea terrae]|uniref:VOC family protein n=1 Tax=Pseudactinotalea terrae TaxID=1743262 RepID=UPI0012E27480|nr:VOC family protein [Pseudactinotalea terrae]
MASPTVGFWELRVTDIDRASAFYGKVFGLVPSAFGEYLLLSTPEGAPIGSLEQVEEAPPSDGFFRPTFDSDDLEADLAAVAAAGGTVIVPRTVISEEFGWWAAVTDPFGNRLQLSTSNAPV